MENRDFRKNLFCAAAKDQRSFKRILELYRPDELKNLLEERVSHRNSLIHLICDDVNLLCLYLAALPEQDRALVVERGTPAFNPFLLAERKPLVMLELLKHVPIELRYAKVNIPCRATSRLILQNLIEQPEFLCSLWSLFSPHDQALLLHGWNDESLLAKFLLNEKLLPIILDFLPKDQVFKHLKFELNKNHHQWISLVAQHRLLSIICSRLTLQEIQSLFRLEHHGESFLKKIAEQKSQFMYFVRDNLALWEIISENEYLYTQLAELLMHQDVFVYILENQGIEAILKIVHHPFVLNMEFAALKPLMLLFIDTLKADQIKSLLAADKSIFKHYLVMLSNDDEIWRHLTKDCDVLLAFLKIFPYEDMLRVLNYELDFGVNLYLYALMNRKIFHQFLASFTSSQRILLLQHAYATIYAPLRHQPEMVSILYQLEELRQKFEALLGSPHVKLEEQISYLMTVHMIDALRRGENLRTCWERLPSIRKEFEISRSFQPKQRFFSALNRIIEQGFHLMEDEATMKTFAESA